MKILKRIILLMFLAFTYLAVLVLLLAVGLHLAILLSTYNESTVKMIFAMELVGAVIILIVLEAISHYWKIKKEN